MRTAFPVTGWLLTRVLTLVLFYGAESWVTGDAGYFDASLRAMRDVGPAHVLVEYPLPAVLVLLVPWLAAGALPALGYSDALMLAALATDAVFAVLLHRFGGRGGAGVWLWVLGVPMLGATAYARFDLLPGVLVGLALLLLAGRPAWAAGCLAVATAVKLWPVLLLPGVLARIQDHRRRGRAVVAVALVGGSLALGSLAVGGWSRLVSPLTYQADRGLQIEAVPALPAMVGWWLDPRRWQVGYGPHHAYEVTGPGVEVLLDLSLVLTVLVLVALGAGWATAWRLRGRLSTGSVIWLTLAAVAGWVVVGKVLSPQYLLWLLPAGAAALVVDGGRSRALLGWCAGLLVAVGLTHLVFPTFYSGLLAPGPGNARSVLLLAARDLVLVALAGVAAANSARRLRTDAQRGSALDRQPPGPEDRFARTLR